MKKLFLISLLCLGFFCPNGFAATTPITKDNYYLIGASGVEVGDKIYDVSFVKDTARNLFFNDATGWSTVFESSDESEAASMALLNQVFDNPVFSIWDDNPNWVTDGDGSSANYINTPFEIMSDDWNGILNTLLKNFSSSTIFPDEVDIGAPNFTGFDDERLYAIWTETGSTSVPVPGAILLLGSGLLGLVGIQRKKKQS